METNLTISIIDECLKNTDSECEDILKTKEALNILKQEKHKISDKYKRLDNEISSKKEEIKKLGYSIENKKPTLNQKQTELDQAISMHASYKSDLSVAESENCWRHSPGRYDQNCLNKKENIRDKVNHWSRYKSKYQNEKNDIESDIKAFEDKKQKIVKEIAALEEKSKTLSENEDINYLNKMLDGIMYYQHQEDLEDINVINDSSYVHSINQVEAAYQN
jgi:chromosome segregation ATPase